MMPVPTASAGEPVLPIRPESPALVMTPAAGWSIKFSTVSTFNYPMIPRTYSPASRLESFTYPLGRTVNLTRNSNNQKLQKVTTAYNAVTKTLLEHIAYNPFGRPKSTETGAGGSVDNQSGACNCLEKINYGKRMEQIYSYDNNGNLTDIAATNTPWFSQDFTYDVQNRLETASASTALSATPTTGRETG